MRARLVTEWLAGHSAANRHHHVDREIPVVLDGGVGVDLQVGEGPPLVEDAQAHLAVALNDPGFAPAGHRGDEQVVGVGGDVVHDRHGGAVVAATVAEHAGAMRAHELASFGGKHVAVGRSGEGLCRQGEEHDEFSLLSTGLIDLVITDTVSP
ncbi:hypothetical protein A5689_00985 [Mycobacterium intracellulare subsp. yongonense]|nr:hypothetical protein A5689_00985 [Mycobacterium intracellulare subsp. yongonense]